MKGVHSSHLLQGLANWGDLNDPNDYYCPSLIMMCKLAYWLCPSDIPDPTIGSGIWVWNLGSGIFPDPRKFSRTRNFPLKPSFLPQNSPNSRFWARSIGLGRNSWFRGFSQGLEKFLTLDSGPKFRTRRMGPECQMGSAIISTYINILTECLLWFRNSTGHQAPHVFPKLAPSPLSSTKLRVEGATSSLSSYHRSTSCGLLLTRWPCGLWKRPR